MNDWLGQILSRAFGSEPEIRPRPLARFEDGGSGEWAVAEPAQSEVQLPSVTQSGQGNSSRQAGFDPVKWPTSPQPAKSFFNEAPALAERSDLLAEPSQPMIEPRKEIIELSSSSREEKIIHTTKIVERLSAENDDEQLRVQTMPPVRPKAESAKPALLQSAPVASPDPLVERKEPVSSTTPTVRISIGRIEISVASTTSVAPRPAPQSAPTSIKPARSLDDYLRRRNGGER